MRPLYEERILPNLAYIGGGGELAYWMQLQAVFEAHHVHFPALILRNSVLLIDENSQKRLDSLRVSPTDLFQRSEEHTSELQSLMRISYAVICLQYKKHTHRTSYGLG